MQNHYAPPRSQVADVNVASGTMTGNMIDIMRRTKPWVFLIGVLLLIFAVFMLLGTIGMLAGSAIMGATAGMSSTMIIVFSIMYGITAVMYLILGIYLFKYSSSIKRLTISGQSEFMENALRAHRKFWKLAGIMTIATIVMTIVAIAVMISAIALNEFK